MTVSKCADSYASQTRSDVAMCHLHIHGRVKSVVWNVEHEREEMASRFPDVDNSTRVHAVHIPHVVYPPPSSALQHDDVMVRVLQTWHKHEGSRVQTSWLGDYILTPLYTLRSDIEHVVLSGSTFCTLSEMERNNIPSFCLVGCVAAWKQLYNHWANNFTKSPTRLISELRRALRLTKDWSQDHSEVAGNWVWEVSGLQKEQKNRVGFQTNTHIRIGIQ